MAEVHFFKDDVDFDLSDSTKITSWILKIAESEKREVEELNIIFTSDEKLLEINREFLKHDYYTDIITFQNQSENLSGEMYLSIERIRENANSGNQNFKDELHRVIAHGLLHIIGYGDKSPEEQVIMRSREDFCLTLRDF